MAETVAATQAENEEISEVRAFTSAMESYILGNFDAGWVFEADTRRGRMPVGLVFGVNTGPFFLVGDMVWLPVASPRNKIESVVNFINEIRRQAHAIWFSSMDEKEFHVHVAKHGIARRIGTSYNAERQAVFEVIR